MQVIASIDQRKLNSCNKRCIPSSFSICGIWTW